MNDYTDTLNLPKTSFSMKANLVGKEPTILKRWQEEDIYSKSLRDSSEFILHDGPPYANGDIHVGTACNKILKDIVLKYKRLKGYRAEFIPGWDTHGLPIELAVTKDIKGDKRDLRRKFRRHAEKYIKRQRADFKRLGILADWDRPYITMDPIFESNQLKIFAELVNNNLVYHSLKPVYWCTTTKTALAEAEVVYREHESDSIYLLFESSSKLMERFNLNNLYYAVWTTTPWTLPANLAIAVNESFEYYIVKEGDRNIIVESSLYKGELKEKLGLGDVVAKVEGRELEGDIYVHPFLERRGKVLLGTHVTNDAGTGCVHTAPGHGLEDYMIGERYGIGIISPVDESGNLTDDAGEELKGLFYRDANSRVMELLKDNLLLHEKISHSYPYSERGKTPTIFRATKQWFIKVDSDMKEKILNILEDVSFIPSVGRNRLSNMIKSRPDWCISRQRVWGVPIPVFYCNSCDEPLLDYDLIISIADAVSKNGSQSFIDRDSEDILEGRYSCCGENNFRKGSDIFDVWFDSGTTYATVLKKLPADLYLEGSDQHRGWFQTSLLTAVGARGESPYRSLLTHGFVVDGSGVKMSKSIGNVTSPQEIVSNYGADILRLWSGSVDFMSDMKISDSIVKQTVENYRKIRNAFRFILGNISDTFDSKDLLKIDRMALNRTHKLVEVVEEHYDRYHFHHGLTEILNYITEMSAFYFSAIKNRLYSYGRDSVERRSAQYILREIGIVLAKILSPILSFTTEEVWGYLSDSSIFTEDWPKVDSLEDSWNDLLALRDLVNNEVEKIIIKGDVSSSTQVSLTLYSSFKDLNSEELKELFRVADVTLIDAEKDRAVVSVFKGFKCARCWLYFTRLDSNNICYSCEEVLKLL